MKLAGGGSCGTPARCVSKSAVRSASLASPVESSGAPSDDRHDEAHPAYSPIHSPFASMMRSWVVRTGLVERSRRADSNRGPLHYESRPKVAPSPRQSLQALPTSQNRGLGRTARNPKARNGVRLVFGRGASLSSRSHAEAQGGPSRPATREHLLTMEVSWCVGRRRGVALPALFSLHVSRSGLLFHPLLQAP